MKIITPPVPVIYEDNHLLVVKKPTNMPVQADSSGDPDLQSVLKEYIREKYKKPGDVFLGIVHRLDRPACGVMIFARTSKAASRLSDQFRKKSVEKNYLAVVDGTPGPEGRLEDFLWKDRSKNVVSVVDSGHPEGKKSVLTYQKLAQSGKLALLGINLLTGRSHQIRVQCAHAGFPLWGDYKYGDGNQPQKRNLALHSRLLRIVHPTQKKELVFAADPPESEPWLDFSTDSIPQISQNSADNDT